MTFEEKLEDRISKGFAIPLDKNPTKEDYFRFGARWCMHEYKKIIKEFISDYDSGLIEDFQIPRDRFDKFIKDH